MIRKIFIGLLICGAVTLEVGAQTADAPAKSKNHRWVLYGGIGPNIYINNIDVAGSKIKELNYSFVARLMWEPEYFLSLGFETGYNRMYSLSETLPNAGQVDIEAVAVPLQFVVSMKFLKNYYFSFNYGQAILYNNVTTTNRGNFHDTVLSLGNFAGTIGYRRDISERFMLGTELKGFYSAKLDDKNIALLFMAGYRLW